MGDFLDYSLLNNPRNPTSSNMLCSNCIHLSKSGNRLWCRIANVDVSLFTSCVAWGILNDGGKKMLFTEKTDSNKRDWHIKIRIYEFLTKNEMWEEDIINEMEIYYSSNINKGFIKEDIKRMLSEMVHDGFLQCPQPRATTFSKLANIVKSNDDEENNNNN